VSQSDVDNRPRRSGQRDEAAVVDLEDRSVEVEDRDVVLDDAQACGARARATARSATDAGDGGRLGWDTSLRFERAGVDSLAVRVPPIARTPSTQSREILVRLLGRSE
jgi:hypothetical protein